MATAKAMDWHLGDITVDIEWENCELLSIKGHRKHPNTMCTMPPPTHTHNYPSGSQDLSYTQEHILQTIFTLTVCVPAVHLQQVFAM